MAEFRKDLIPNYIIGIAIVFVFLGGFIFTLVNLETIVDEIVVEGDASGTAVRSAIATALVTAMIFITKETTTYFFRKNPAVTT
jgi:phosphate/sulfate permease